MSRKAIILLIIEIAYGGGEDGEARGGEDGNVQREKRTQRAGKREMASWRRVERERIERL